MHARLTAGAGDGKDAPAESGSSSQPAPRSGHSMRRWACFAKTSRAPSCSSSSKMWNSYLRWERIEWVQGSCRSAVLGATRKCLGRVRSHDGFGRTIRADHDFEPVLRIVDRDGVLVLRPNVGLFILSADFHRHGQRAVPVRSRCRAQTCQCDYTERMQQARRTGPGNVAPGQYFHTIGCADPRRPTGFLGRRVEPRVSYLPLRPRGLTRC